MTYLDEYVLILTTILCTFQPQHGLETDEITAERSERVEQEPLVGSIEEIIVTEQQEETRGFSNQPEIGSLLVKTAVEKDTKVSPGTATRQENGYLGL